MADCTKVVPILIASSTIIALIASGFTATKPNIHGSFFTKVCSLHLK